MGNQYRSPIYSPVFLITLSQENQLNRYTKCNQHYTINDNDYFIDVTNLGLHNKDFALVTQASILVIYILLR